MSLSVLVYEDLALKIKGSPAADLYRVFLHLNGSTLIPPPLQVAG
jgi:hypothetical protein